MMRELRVAQAARILADMPSISRYFSAFALLVTVATIHPQKVTEIPLGGTVEGRITYADTHRPVRFAYMQIIRVPVNGPLPKPGDGAGLATSPPANPPFPRREIKGIETMTDVDGRYSITEVAPGYYYLAPGAPGYVSPIVTAHAARTSEEPDGTVLAGVPIVHVEAGHTVRGDVAMERGAAISGAVTFEDGAPVMVNVSLERIGGPPDRADASIDGVQFALTNPRGPSITDDRGRFRLWSLPPGQYRVIASVMANSSFAANGSQLNFEQYWAPPIVFYAPGTLHKAAATIVTLRAGEERKDLNIRVSLAGMHTVSGRVTSSSDKRPIDSGSVVLVSVADKDVQRASGLDATGAFHVTFLAPGEYTLIVRDAAVTEPIKPRPCTAMSNTAKRNVKSYDDVSRPLTIGAANVTGLNIELTESKTVKKTNCIDLGEN